MADMLDFFTTCRRLGAAALVLAAATINGAEAQNVVAFVNGEPITALDIEQRAKLVEVSEHQAPQRQKVLDELINEKLKVREAKRWGIEASDSEVDAAFAGTAGRVPGHPNVEQFTQMLAKSGVTV